MPPPSSRLQSIRPQFVLPSAPGHHGKVPPPHGSGEADSKKSEKQ